MSTLDERLRTLARLVADHEETHGLSQRGFVYSHSPSGTESARQYVFGQRVTLRGIHAALGHLEAVARDYGLEVPR